MINMLTIFAQSFLLISSLSFHLPDKSRIGNEFYEYTELRYHSIIFSFRFIFIILLIMYLIPYNKLRKFKLGIEIENLNLFTNIFLLDVKYNSLQF